MIIINLKGRSNTGKTSSLNMLRLKLIKCKYNEICIYRREVTEDFCSVFEIEGKIVGLLSEGDDVNVIKKGFLDMNQYNCDIG